MLDIIFWYSIVLVDKLIVSLDVGRLHVNEIHSIDIG